MSRSVLTKYCERCRQGSTYLAVLPLDNKPPRAPTGRQNIDHQHGCSILTRKMPKWIPGGQMREWRRLRFGVSNYLEGCKMLYSQQTDRSLDER